MLSVSALATGCASSPLLGTSAGEHLQYLTDAINADPKAREQRWTSASRAQPETLETELHLALLQTVPGHSGYNPGGAEARLKALLARNPSAGITEVARAQLAQLRLNSECQKEAQSLRERLAQMVNIERNFKDGH